MTDLEQRKFAAYLRNHIPKPPGEKYHHPMTIFTEFSARTLGKPVSHWRDLSVDDARTVMKAAANLPARSHP